jgi:hypothetical protein
MVFASGPTGPREDGDVIAIEITRSFAAEATYQILAGLPLAADAANLHRPSEPAGRWAGPLGLAYRAAPERLQLQSIGLRHETMAALLEALRGGPAGMRDPASRRVARVFADALARYASPRDFEADAEAHAQRRRAFERDAQPDLVTLRAALYETHDASPPPLRIVDCPALGPHGRATTLYDGTQLVAVSLATDPEAALMQVFHEQIHPVTDPLVAADRPRETAVGRPGYAVHARIERLALDVGAALVEARAPHRADAYTRWMSRFG